MFPFQSMRKLKLHSRLFAPVFDLLKTFLTIRNKCQLKNYFFFLENCSKIRVHVRGFEGKHTRNTAHTQKITHFQNARKNAFACIRHIDHWKWNRLKNSIVRKYLNMQLAIVWLQSFLCTSEVRCFHFLIIILTNTPVNKRCSAIRC